MREVNTLSRRSFFGAIVGTLAAPLIAARLPKSAQQAALEHFDELWEHLKAECESPVWRPFWIWEYAELSGEAGRIEVLPPPLPPEMLLQQTIVAFPSSVLYNDLAGVFRSWSMRINQNGKDLLQTPLRFLDPHAGFPFVIPVRVIGSDNLKIELEGDAFETQHTVIAQVVFKGVVKIQ